MQNFFSDKLIFRHKGPVWNWPLSMAGEMFNFLKAPNEAPGEWTPR